MNLKAFLSSFKTPAGIVSVLSTLVAVLGTAGILSTGLSGALQAALTAVLGVITATGHTVAVTALARRAAAKHLPVE
ncbi:hypothetical protein ORV05_05060 [Amycolatopsis cynarae]|uniref:Holin n=1 Tax=Amycolatopsis cynarae TaxID=2995223 RepID=A0ABY7B7C1_9PSEU|nr:hypothetical protein [Amycolatopsis sp. HUAS 11-8]WAL67162.1 hypothetical protein ORV05_05060 [Amycolatopsis sp. HUAS 11-8]